MGLCIRREGVSIVSGHGSTFPPGPRIAMRVKTILSSLTMTGLRDGKSTDGMEIPPDEQLKRCLEKTAPLIVTIRIQGLLRRHITLVPVLKSLVVSKFWISLVRFKVE